MAVAVVSSTVITLSRRMGLQLPALTSVDLVIMFALIALTFTLTILVAA